MADELAGERNEQVQLLRRLTRAFMQNVPHNLALQIEVTELEDHRASMRLPFSPAIAAAQAPGGIHDVALASLMDACCGAAVFMALDKPRPVATLDLRVDYLAAAVAARAVVAEAHCHRVTGEVAYVRCRAFHAADEPPLAEATGAFMLDTQEVKTGSVARAAAKAAEKSS